MDRFMEPGHMAREKTRVMLDSPGREFAVRVDALAGTLDLLAVRMPAQRRWSAQ
jgi:hypothetical protein